MMLQNSSNSLVTKVFIKYIFFTFSICRYLHTLKQIENNSNSHSV